VKQLYPEYRELQDRRNRVSGSVAAAINTACDLGFDMFGVTKWNGRIEPDEVMPWIYNNMVKQEECERFAQYLCKHGSLAAQLLGHADPQIAAIMSKTTDAMGNTVSEDALTAMHLQDLKDYFDHTGQPDLTLPGWDMSKEPLKANIKYTDKGFEGGWVPQNDSCKMQ
jgi:hypothetical protein